MNRKFKTKFSEEKKTIRSKSHSQYELNDSEQIIKLRLSGLRLSEFPIEIIQFKNLQELDLRNNKLTSWPVEMADLVNLQQLDLSRNKLNAWPIEMEI